MTWQQDEPEFASSAPVARVIDATNAQDGDAAAAGGAASLGSGAPGVAANQVLAIDDGPVGSIAAMDW